MIKGRKVRLTLTITLDQTDDLQATPIDVDDVYQAIQELVQDEEIEDIDGSMWLVTSIDY